VASSSLFEPTPAASRRRWQSTLEERLESGPATALTVATTLWALVGDDIRLTAFRAQHDAFFLIGTLGCIAHFTLEGGARAATPLATTLHMRASLTRLLRFPLAPQCSPRWLKKAISAASTSGWTSSPPCRCCLISLR
jgi:hypothetical protein